MQTNQYSLNLYISLPNTVEAVLLPLFLATSFISLLAPPILKLHKPLTCQVPGLYKQCAE